MRYLFTMLFLLLSSAFLYAQGSEDPTTLLVSKSTTDITIDGMLDEAGWSADLPYLIFKIGGSPMGNGYTPTGHAIVKPNYVDTTTTNVRFLFSGTDLYISLDSDDQQVCRFGDSWEGDGLFMKIRDASGGDVEYKLYYNLPGVDTTINYEGPVESSGAAVKGDATVVNDSSNVDNGYTAELHIDLAALGYSEVPDSLELILVIFDPDNYSDGVAPWGPNGNFAKQWWGSEWGDPKRTLVFDKNGDPESLPVYMADEIITLDGVLDEAVWNNNNPKLKFQIGGVGTGNIYTPTSHAIVKAPYSDSSTTYVQFTYVDSFLYIALNSDDKQVCRFGDSWEGDGLFMKIKDASNSDVEYKLYYNLPGVDTTIHYEGPGHSAGAGNKGSETIVGDSTNIDNGYTAELRINLAGLGFTELPENVQVLINIFDPNNYSDGVAPWGPNGNFAKQWWGSEWGPDMRTLTLISGPDPVNVDPQSLQVSYNAEGVTMDGTLDEGEWSDTDPMLNFEIGANGMDNIYVPTGYEIIKPSYVDVSSTLVRFQHDGNNLYISLDSDDNQVCRFGNSWEGDGLFMKIKNASGSDVEFKLYYNLAGVDPEINYEGPANSEGYGTKGDATIVNDSTNVDNGYTAELRIDLVNDLGFTSLPDSVEVLINIFDPDNYSDGVESWLTNGNFAKQWWGSQWGPEKRTLFLETPSDPPSLPVAQMTNVIVIDGVLDEAEWGVDVQRLKFQIGGEREENVHLPTGYEIIKPPYVDASTTIVRFLHDQNNLYISLESDDQQVCRFGDSWEGDGLFMKIKNATGSDVEFKLYYNLAGVDPEIHYEGPANSEGAGVKGDATIVNDSTNVDNGYTAELRIDLVNDLGFITMPDSLEVLINIFDPDNYSDGVAPWGVNGNFAKQWWGSQWGPDMRVLYLTDNIVSGIADNGDVIPNHFVLKQNYPNPFNPSTTIEYSIPSSMEVKVEIFNMLGANVATLINGKQNSGNHKIEWNGRNASGNQAASGIYMYRVTTPGKSITRKMILIK